MATTVIYSNHFKYSILKKLIDLSADSVKVLLMRDGFTFNKDTVATFLNITATTVINSTTNTIIVSNASNSFTRTSGSWITDGFIIGNKVVTTNMTDAGNNGSWLISNVTALVMTVTDLAGADPTLTDKTDSVTTNLTWASNDELVTGFGYTQNTKTTGTITLTEDDSADAGSATFPTVTWTASGGSIGPTPGAILYDDTSADNCIICYIDFGGNQTATDGTTFNLYNGLIKAS